MKHSDTKKKISYNGITYEGFYPEPKVNTHRNLIMLESPDVLKMFKVTDILKGCACSIYV